MGGRVGAVRCEVAWDRLGWVGLGGRGEGGRGGVCCFRVFGHPLIVLPTRVWIACGLLLKYYSE